MVRTEEGGLHVSASRSSLLSTTSKGSKKNKRKIKNNATSQTTREQNEKNELMQINGKFKKPKNKNKTSKRKRKHKHKHKANQGQSSIISIFTIWNTMMGTSLLVLPWAIAESGFLMGIFCIFAMMFMALYRYVQRYN